MGLDIGGLNLPKVPDGPGGNGRALGLGMGENKPYSGDLSGAINRGKISGMARWE